MMDGHHRPDLGQDQMQQRLKLAQARILEHASVAATLEELYRDIITLIEGEDRGVRCSILRADSLRSVLHDAVAPSLPAEYNARVNDLPIAETARKFHWPLGPRPKDHPGLSDLDL